MAKVRRLVYLPDPTVKFYKSIKEEDWEDDDDDIYCDYDLKTYGLEEEANKSTELIVKNKRVLFRDLRERMNSNNYDKPYFTGLIDNIALFEVISLED